MEALCVVVPVIVLIVWLALASLRHEHCRLKRINEGLRVPSTTEQRAREAFDVPSREWRAIPTPFPQTNIEYLQTCIQWKRQAPDTAGYQPQSEVIILPALPAVYGGQPATYENGQPVADDEVLRVRKEGTS